MAGSSATGLAVSVMSYTEILKGQLVRSSPVNSRVLKGDPIVYELLISNDPSRQVKLQVLTMVVTLNKNSCFILESIVLY